MILQQTAAEARRIQLFLMELDMEEIFLKCKIVLFSLNLFILENAVIKNICARGPGWLFSWLSGR